MSNTVSKILEKRIKEKKEHLFLNEAGKKHSPIKVMAICGHKQRATIKRYLALSPKYINMQPEAGCFYTTTLPKNSSKLLTYLYDGHL